MKFGYAIKTFTASIPVLFCLLIGEERTLEELFTLLLGSSLVWIPYYIIWWKFNGFYNLFWEPNPNQLYYDPKTMQVSTIQTPGSYRI